MGWRIDYLLHLCADEKVDVEWMDLGPHMRGGYDHSRSLIVLNTRLTVAQATATLAHECGHQAFGDECSTPAVELEVTPRLIEAWRRWFTKRWPVEQNATIGYN